MFNRLPVSMLNYNKRNVIKNGRSMYLLIISVLITIFSTTISYGENVTEKGPRSPIGVNIVVFLARVRRESMVYVYADGYTFCPKMLKYVLNKAISA